MRNLLLGILIGSCLTTAVVGAADYLAEEKRRRKGVGPKKRGRESFLERIPPERTRSTAPT